MAAALNDININNELPPELLRKVFMCCNLEELVNLSDVCRLWRDLIKDYLHNTVKYLNFTHATQRVLELNDSVFKAVTDIDVLIHNPDIIRNLVTLLARVERVISLRVVWDDGDTIMSNAVLMLPTYSTNKVLGKKRKSSNSQTSLTDALIGLKAVACLKSLSFRVDSCHDSYGLTSIGRDHYVYSPLLDALLSLVVLTSRDKLTSLELVGVRLQNTEGSVFATRHVRQAIESCRNLMHVTLRQCILCPRQWCGNSPPHQYRGDCIQLIPALTHLTHLDLRGSFQYHEGMDLSFVEALKSRCMNVSNNILLERVNIRPKNNFAMLQFLHQVQFLSLENLDSDQLRCVIYHADCADVHVGELAMWCHDHVTDDILLSLTLALRSVKRVDAAYHQHVTNEGVASLLTSVPTLEGVDVRGVKNINDSLIRLLQDVPAAAIDAQRQFVEILAHYTTLDEQKMIERTGAQRIGRRVLPKRQLNAGKYGNITIKF